MKILEISLKEEQGNHAEQENLCRHLENSLYIPCEYGELITKNTKFTNFNHRKMAPAIPQAKSIVSSRTF